VTDTSLLTELNRDVWQPFRTAYRAYDTQACLALHTPDLIRVGGPRRTVQGYAEMAAETGPWFAAPGRRSARRDMATVPFPGGSGTVGGRNGIGPDPPRGAGTD
jgi:hypothetical protein